MIERALDEPSQWIIADQVYFELYRLLRNPAALTSPLTADEAARTVSWYRGKTGWLHCAYEPDMMNRIAGVWSEAAFGGRNTFDLVLAVTLAANGVSEFHTRNASDFTPFGLFTVYNPIDLA